MNTRTMKARLVSGLIVICLFAGPVAIESQCNVVNTMTTMPAASTIGVTKTLSAATSCMTTGMNAFSCFPGATSFGGNMLYAVAMTATAAPFCNWDCGCGTGAPPDVVIDGSDGLPVELMGFSIED